MVIKKKSVMGAGTARQKKADSGGTTTPASPATVKKLAVAKLATAKLSTAKLTTLRKLN